MIHDVCMRNEIYLYIPITYSLLFGMIFHYSQIRMNNAIVSYSIK